VQDTIRHNLEQLGKNSGRIIITAHHKPDGDAIGSSLGLYQYFKNAGIDSRVIVPTDYASNLNWLPGNKDVKIYEENIESCDADIANAAYIFCLDFNALTRINEMGKMVRASSATIIMIDHHQNPEDFDHERFVEIGASSTCELIYRYINEHLDSTFVDEKVGQCIYTGLITDTGSFRFSSTTSTTIRTAADLMDLGVVPDKIYRSLFDQNRLERLQLLGHLLSNNLEIIEDGKIALGYLSLQDIERFNIITGDTEGFVNYGLGIAGVKMSALFIDRGPIVKMSFRSTDTFPCNIFSSENFNGGGHKNAAGGASHENLQQTIDKFKAAIKNYRAYL
jgi:phosphoesterase RecJ-like protein